MLRHLQTPKLHSPSSNLRLSKKVLDFRIQISSDSKSLGIPVRGQKTGHVVIRQMHAVWPFIHQYRDRGVRSGIRNVLCHFLHDERIANHKAHDFRIVPSGLLTQNRAMPLGNDAAQPRPWAALQSYFRRINDPVYQPSDARLCPNYDVLTDAVHKENNENNRGRAHKQDREDDQSGDHLPDIIEAYCRSCGKADPKPLLPVYPANLCDKRVNEITGLAPG